MSWGYLQTLKSTLAGRIWSCPLREELTGLESWKQELFRIPLTYSMEKQWSDEQNLDFAVGNWQLSVLSECKQ